MNDYCGTPTHCCWHGVQISASQAAMDCINLVWVIHLGRIPGIIMFPHPGEYPSFNESSPYGSYLCWHMVHNQCQLATEQVKAFKAQFDEKLLKRFCLSELRVEFLCLRRPGADSSKIFPVLISLERLFCSEEMFFN